MILVTGANGFVGRAVCRQLSAAGHSVTAAWRGNGPPPEGALRVVRIPSIGPEDDFRALLEDCSAVVHLAARVHVMWRDASDDQAAYWRTNVGGTLNLARQAAEVEVRRFVYLSTAKVLGEAGDLGARRNEPCCPEDAYSRSKLDAEQGLTAIAADTGLPVVVLRPPLVYGPGVGANFLRLMRGVDRGWPLPLGSVNNRRSMIYVGNLADAIRICIEHPKAIGKSYLVSDGEDLSTPDLVRRLARELSRPPRLFQVPISWLRVVARLSGRTRELDRLVGSLYFDASDLGRDLGWVAPTRIDDAIAETVRWYRASGDELEGSPVI